MKSPIFRFLTIVLLFIIAFLFLAPFGNQNYNANATGESCWTCDGSGGIIYRCVGVYENGFYNCGQTNPYDCILSGPGCNVELQ